MDGLLFDDNAGGASGPARVAPMTPPAITDPASPATVRMRWVGVTIFSPPSHVTGRHGEGVSPQLTAVWSPQPFKRITGQPALEAMGEVVNRRPGRQREPFADLFGLGSHATRPRAGDRQDPH